VNPAARPARLRRWLGVWAWTLWALAIFGLAVTVWLDRLLRQAGRPDLAELAALPAVALVSAATVGAVLASRRPAHPVGWLLLALGLFMAAGGVASQYAPYGLLARPGALPAASAVALYYPVTAVAAGAALGFVLLLTPTGSLPSPRWRWWARIMVAVPVGCLLVVILAPNPLGQSYQAVDNPLDLHAFGGVVLESRTGISDCPICG